MFPFWLIMLALSRPSPNNSILPWPRSCKYSGISPITNKTIQQKYAAWKGEKWETYVWILHVKSVASKGMICIVWPKHAVSSHGTSKVKRKNKVGGDISRRDGITILLSKPKKKNPEAKRVRKHLYRAKEIQNLLLLQYNVVLKDLGRLIKRQIFWENLQTNDCCKPNLWPKPKWIKQQQNNT